MPDGRVTLQDVADEAGLSKAAASYALRGLKGSSQTQELVRDIAETLKYAHSKRLYHRALGPQSILVHGIGGGALHLRLMNWQTASRNVGESASPYTVHRTTGTQHVEDYVEDPGMIYLACLLYTSPSPRDGLLSRMPSSA